MRAPLLSLPAGRRLAGLLTGLALLAGPVARAQTVYGLGTLTMDFLGNPAGAQGLVPLDPVTGMAGTAIPVTGVAAQQSLVGMDFRASNGQLYALGYDSAALAPAPQGKRIKKGCLALSFLLA